MFRVRRGMFVSGIAVAAATTVVSSSPGAFGGAYLAYVEIKGQKQGQFKAEAPQKEWANKWMEVLSFKAGESSQFDSNSGQVSGRRKHDPMCFTKHAGAATPQIFTALSTNESLPEVEFDFLRPDNSGQTKVFETIKLTNAAVVQARQQLGVEGEAPGHTMEAFDEVCLTFMKIEIKNNDGNTLTIDNWM